MRQRFQVLCLAVITLGVVSLNVLAWHTMQGQRFATGTLSLAVMQGAIMTHRLQMIELALTGPGAPEAVRPILHEQGH